MTPIARLALRRSIVQGRPTWIARRDQAHTKSSLSRPDLTRAALVQAIVGRAVERIAKRATMLPAEDVALAVRLLARHPHVAAVSFDLRRDEVLGLAGFVGAGPTKLARLVYGADRSDAGTMVLEGRYFAPRSTAAAVKAVLGLVPEERRA